MDVEHNKSTEQNTSMEELKVEEDENIKETSLEDILGAQSLLMSESDEDNESKNNTNKSPVKKIISKRPKRIVDSDEEEGYPKKIENNVSIKNKKISILIDSDSEEDTYKTENTTKQLKGQIDTEEVEDTQEIDFKELKLALKKKSKKISKNNNLGKHINNESNNKSNKKSIKSKENQVFEDINKISLSDDESSHKDKDSEDENLKNDHIDGNSKEKPKAIRASAKKALDEMQAIQSEQQRLHREAHISVPYHKPKKHTLDEFLKRRTIIQPLLSNTNASPVATAVQAKRLKMTTEELEEYAKLMEERAKEATEFFRSESDSEDEVFKDNEGVLDRNNRDNDQSSSAKESANLSSEKIKVAESTEQPHMMNEVKENLDGVEITEDELAEILKEQYKVEDKNKEIYEKPACSKVLITEVIELPKLDMNTIRISPIKKPTPRSSFNIKEILKEKNLSGSPSLSGDPNKLIDLETGDLIEKKSTGVENLMKRLMATVKNKKSKTTETCTILSVENGKLEMSKVNISLTEAKDVQKEPKPGAAYFQLKSNLKEIIKKKRLDDLIKKQEDDLEYSKCLADDDDYDINEYEDEEKENEDMKVENEEYEPGYKPKSKVVVVDNEEHALAVEEDDENEEVDDNENEEVEDEDEESIDSDEENQETDSENLRDKIIDEEDNSSENNKDIKNTQTQRKNRIIKAFVDSDEEGDKDDIDFLKTQPPVTQPLLFETQAPQKTTLENKDADDLMALCSGAFDTTQKTTSNVALMSQIPRTQNNGQTLNDEELVELCSGTFDQPAEVPQSEIQINNSLEEVWTKSNKILSSDDEKNKVHPKELNKKRNKKLTKKLKKRKAKLGFSDDEDDDKEEVDCNEDLEQDETYDAENVAEDFPDTFVDYDSEENEILVQMTKTEKVLRAQNFVENEAELSESEWGSADEDENNLDRYDIELGDEDEFDREKLQTELGKIHARKMLDEDIREVRKIQDMLFEDEEKDGVGRQRTFKWKNAESGFNLDDDRQREEMGDGVNGDSDDEISEHQWRKVRYEREQFLKEQGLKPDSQDVSTILPNTTIPLINNTVNSTITTKKLQIISTKKYKTLVNDSKKSSPFLISKDITTMNRKSVRGSFLVRDKETLNKLAGLTKGAASSNVSSEIDNTAGTVSVKSITPKNFVFATLTEEEHENLKRKADDLLNSSTESGKNFMKKPKLEPRRDKCFIDQLL